MDQTGVLNWYSFAHLRQDHQAIDSLNRLLLEKVQLGGRAFLSGTVMNDTFSLRVCMVNPQTCRQDVEALIEIVRDRGRQCAEKRERSDRK
jgi:hypothetical protein